MPCAKPVNARVEGRGGIRERFRVQMRLVPQGRPTIAHRLNGGSGMTITQSPEGAKELFRPSGTVLIRDAPSDESLGYCRSSLRD